MKKILVVMDTPDTVHPDKDTSFALGEAATARGHQLYYATVKDLFINDGVPGSLAAPMRFERNLARPVVLLGAYESQELDSFDVVLMRKDPPYNMDYIFSSHVLSLAKKAKVLNSPKGLREAPEKIYPLLFPGIFPPTLIGKRLEMLREFAQKHGDVILKPLDGNGGRGVLKSGAKDPNFVSMCELLTNQYSEYVIIQKYLPEILQGDKRIILLDGKPEGLILRKQDGIDLRTNLHVGGKALMSEMSSNDKKLCEIIGERLRADGLYFVGIDVIGSYITEINVTSPTGIQEIKALGGQDIARMFWEKLGM